MKEKFEALVDHLVSSGFFLEEVVELLERTLIEKTLERTGGNRSEASKRLGIHRNTLQRKMAEYHLGPRKPRTTKRKPVRGETRTRKRAIPA
jgi:DNA-binding NtrC family response regulator